MFELRRLDGAAVGPAASIPGGRGAPLVVERGRFDGGAPVHDALWGLGGATVMTLIVASPAPEPGALDRARETVAAGDRAGFTIVDDGGALVVRHLTGVAERARSFVQAVWAASRPSLFDRVPVAPRIWFT